jgi:hypothetical protein
VALRAVAPSPSALRFPDDVHQSEPFLPAFHYDTQDESNPARVKLVLNTRGKKKARVA